MLTAKRLRKVLSYAPTTGIFRWKVSAGSRAPVGARAGAKNGRGYRQIGIGGRPYSAVGFLGSIRPANWRNSKTAKINVSRPTRDGENLGKPQQLKIRGGLRENRLKVCGWTGQKIISAL